MKFIIALIICTTISTLLNTQIKRHPQIIYLLVLIITSLFYLPLLSFQTIKPVAYISQYFTNGYLSLAFFTIVMFIGTINSNHKLIKKLLLIRTQLSIIGTILLLPHLILLFKICYHDLIKIRFSIPFISSLLSLSLVILLSILFITSFTKIKRKIKDISWKKIQKLSYLFYLLLYIHLVIVNIPRLKFGFEGSALNIIIYSFIFYVYLILKLKQKIKNSKTYFALITMSIPITLLISLFLLSQIYFSPPIQKQEERPLAFIPPPDIEKNIQESDDIIKENNESLSKKELINILNEKNQNTSDKFIILGENPPIAELPSIPSTIDVKEELIEKNQNEKYKDGIYTTKAMGHDGDIIIKTVLSNDQITNIIIKYTLDDDRHFEQAFYTIKEEIISKQTSQVDSIAGATKSSEGIINAVKKALELASIKK